ncbi:aromatic amino acid decarboxylase [Pseudooceanicola batsensis HTCC2597]|uniref:Aromatic amino acid decarboxylase n=1 Tax=Pseudooceanicola batsensis (strain ATCC BAA-863 / DSM 15984 / KCTC 12145 / HTCC2597) TaxID=252305 RepID=A3U0N1_PSEBH|nr:pyridoxal-dependent decarboxylase [Pseudooceanicola batsensis]EAQ02322.1 aromatic amino acid decarboxylase [Pseudooceanicola batsensis HTCC2597]
MTPEDFESWSRRAADWGARYRRTLGDRPVRARTDAGEIYRAIPAEPPQTGEEMAAIFEDFENIILPGMTHWQHPRFFAYFPANAAPVSVVAEYLVTAMAAQCMLWQTSPAATELETRMMEWLRDAVGLPGTFSGVIQDSASSATLAAMLVMRERALDWQGNVRGLAGGPAPRVYCSDQVHSSIDRAAWVSGIGQDNLIKLPAEASGAMPPDALDAAIRADFAAGHRPAGVVACVGGTSTGASDDIRAVVEVAQRHALYVHVDAAWAGAAMICPEFRDIWAGVEQADSVVFNPHKWLGASFDCSAHLVRDPETLVKTLAIQPEYLKTHGQDGVIDYSEWSIPLGRRFRALKLWFLLRFHGLEGLRGIIRDHVRWSGNLCERLRATEGVEIVTEPALSLFSFRRAGATDDETIAHLRTINDEGRIYLTQTRVGDRIAIRFQAGSHAMTEADTGIAYDAILDGFGLSAGTAG